MATREAASKSDSKYLLCLQRVKASRWTIALNCPS